MLFYGRGTPVFKIVNVYVKAHVRELEPLRVLKGSAHPHELGRAPTSDTTLGPVWVIQTYSF